MTYIFNHILFSTINYSDNLWKWFSTQLSLLPNHIQYINYPSFLRRCSSQEWQTSGDQKNSLNVSVHVKQKFIHSPDVNNYNI